MNKRDWLSHFKTQGLLLNCQVKILENPKSYSLWHLFKAMENRPELENNDDRGIPIEITLRGSVINGLARVDFQNLTMELETEVALDPISKKRVGNILWKQMRAKAAAED